MYDSSTTNGATQSLWYSELSSADAATLRGSGAPIDVSDVVDVAVIGGGMAGLSVAYQLCLAGQSVVLVEKGWLGRGESGRTTAHLSSALDDRYTKIERVHGEEAARLAAASHVAAIDEIERSVAAEQIECEFERLPGYLFSSRAAEDGRAELNEELGAALRAGLRVELIRELGGAWGSDWHLRFAAQAQLQPLAYLAGLARAIHRIGGRIYTQMRVLELETGAAEHQVRLHGGQTLRARNIVVATNTPINDRVTMHTKQAAYRTYAVALSLPEPLPPALLWDTGDPYHYVRLADSGRTLIVGGEDHKVGQSGAPETAWSRLEHWTRQRFPQVQELRSRWSGQVQEPADGLAFIGQNPGSHERVFIVTGDSGNGMTHGAIAGLLLRDLIGGRSHPWSALYAPTRKPDSGALGDFVRENANVALHFAEGLLPPVSSHSIEPGTGAIVRRGLLSHALYVAPDGTAHECSAKCPHLGCTVQWNRAEQSWDCPCHGSRFDPYGRVLTGPAVQDLTPIKSNHTAR